MHPLGNLIPWIAATSILGLLGVTLIHSAFGRHGCRRGRRTLVTSRSVLVVNSRQLAGLSVVLRSRTGAWRDAFHRYTQAIRVVSRRLAGTARTVNYFLSSPREDIGLWFAPSVRLIAPGIAGLLRAQPRNFLVATIFGVALWNSLLLGVGYTGALIDDSTNPSAVAVKVVFVLLVGEGVAAAAWRGILIRRGNRDRHSSKRKIKVQAEPVL